MNMFKSLQAKIVVLATVPVLLVAATLAIQSYFEINRLGQEELEQVETLMMQDRRERLKSYIDHALTAIVHLEKNDENQERVKPSCAICAMGNPDTTSSTTMMAPTWYLVQNRNWKGRI